MSLDNEDALQTVVDSGRRRYGYEVVRPLATEGSRVWTTETHCKPWRAVASVELSEVVRLLPTGESRVWTTETRCIP